MNHNKVISSKQFYTNALFWRFPAGHVPGSRQGLPGQEVFACQYHCFTEILADNTVTFRILAPKATTLRQRRMDARLWRSEPWSK
jgi:hypothetical protein